MLLGEAYHLTLLSEMFYTFWYCTVYTAFHTVSLHILIIANCDLYIVHY